MNAGKGETRKLMCRLTPEELLVRGQDLAATLEEVEAQNERKRCAGEKVKAGQERADELRGVILNRQELRDVYCTKVPTTDYMMEIVRGDTFELVERRPMTMSERQLDLPLESQDDREAFDSFSSDEPPLDYTERMPDGAGEPAPDLTSEIVTESTPFDDEPPTGEVDGTKGVAPEAPQTQTLPPGRVAEQKPGVDMGSAPKRRGRPRKGSTDNGQGALQFAPPPPQADPMVPNESGWSADHDGEGKEVHFFAPGEVKAACGAAERFPDSGLLDADFYLQSQLCQLCWEKMNPEKA